MLWAWNDTLSSSVIHICNINLEKIPKILQETDKSLPAIDYSGIPGRGQVVSLTIIFLKIKKW